MGVQTTRVLGIGGTTRQNSSSERALRVAAAAAADAGATVELITGEELVLPLYDPEKSARTERATALVAALRDADALLISSPGYHGTVSGMVKNALDYVEDLRDDERSYLAGLPVGCIAVAYGWQASVATLQTLRTCAHALRGWPTPMGAALNASIPGLFDPVTGACTDESARFQLQTVGRQVVEFAAARLGGERVLAPAPTWTCHLPSGRRYSGGQPSGGRSFGPSAHFAGVEGRQMRRDAGPDFIEALARGLDVLRCFQPGRPYMTLSEVAAEAQLARPTARRILITLQKLGYVRSDEAGFSLTPRVLELGMTYIGSQNIWELAEPHLRTLVDRTRESCSIAQLDGSDIVYVSRVAMPKLVTLSVTVGTRFPAVQTSLGKVLLAALDGPALDRVLAQPSRSGITPRRHLQRDELDEMLRDVRAKGWAVTDEELALGIRSVAAPIRNGQGRTVAAVNVNAHAAETSVDRLVEHHLPLLLRTAGDISADWAAWENRPLATLAPRAG